MLGCNVGLFRQLHLDRSVFGVLVTQRVNNTHD